MRTPLKTFGPRIKTFESRRVLPPEKRAASFYLSPSWRRLLDEIVAERGRVCEDPACADRDCSHRRIYGDHIVELADGGAPLDRSNILLRCAPCHGLKTAAARSARRLPG